MVVKLVFIGPPINEDNVRRFTLMNAGITHVIVSTNIGAIASPLR